MSDKGVLFWNVDTQEDFIDPQGKLYVQGAESIRPALKQITGWAKTAGIRVVNTCDYHQINAEEISEYPDYITKFPSHCMAGSSGARFILETEPESPLIIDWDLEITIIAELDDPIQFRNIVLRKNAFDVFAGNRYTDTILQILKPDIVFVYGVTTNICVDNAVMGLTDRGIKVYVVKEAIKELPDLPLPYRKWKVSGVEMITIDELKEYLLSNSNS